MKDNISVVIPLFNKAPYIARAIKSVLNQTIQNFEIVVVDDNSSDDGPTIVKNFNDSRITFIAQEHRGVSYTRNHGVNQAKNDFIAFLDADDEWMPNQLEILFRLKERFPYAGIYTSSYQIRLKSGKLVKAQYRAIPKAPFEGLLPNYFEAATRGEDPVAVSVAAISKELFFKTGGFPVDEAKGEDVDLWAKIALQNPVAFSSDIGGIYHKEASARACDSYHSIKEEPFVKNGKKAIAEGRVPKNILPFFREYIARKEIDTAVINIYAGDYPLAKKILARTETRYFWKEKIKWNIIIRIPKPFFNLIRYIKNFMIR